jgi:Na+-driven multidrug efflux pump
LFYGANSVYTAQTLALRIGVIATIIYVPMTIFGAVLTGAGRTKTNASMHGAGAAASLASSPPLIYVWGAAGAMLVEVVSRSARLVWAIRFLRSTSASFLGDQKEVQDRAS